MIFKRADIVLFIILINVLVSLTAGFFTSDYLHIGIMRAALMALMIPLLMIDGVRLTWTAAAIFACLVYLICLVPFSSAPVKTFDVVAKVAISLLMFVMAYNYIRGEAARRKLSKLVSICLALFFINFIIAQIFGIGINPYYEEGLKAGAGNVQQTYLIAYLLIFSPLVGFYRNEPFRIRWWEATIMLFALFPLALIGRRGALLGLLAGLVIYTVFTPKKTRVFGAIGVAALLAAATLPLYIHHVYGVLEDRMRETDTPDQIGRVQEMINGIELVRYGELKEVLFGRELFNYVSVTRDFRDLHTDYAAYLLSAGLIGFLLYFSIIPALWLDYWRRLRCVRRAALAREFTGVFIGLIAAYIIISFSGQYYVVSSLSLVFSLWGALLASIEELAVPSDEIQEEDVGDAPEHQKKQELQRSLV